MNLDEKASFGEAYLEHFGVRGMKWGRRKSGTASDSTSDTTPDVKTPMSGRKKVAIAAGAAAVAGLMQKHGLLLPALSKTAGGAVHVASILGNVSLEVVGKPFFMLYKPPIG